MDKDTPKTVKMIRAVAIHILFVLTLLGMCALFLGSSDNDYLQFSWLLMLLACIFFWCWIALVVALTYVRSFFSALIMFGFFYFMDLISIFGWIFSPGSVGHYFILFIEHYSEIKELFPEIFFFFIFLAILLGILSLVGSILFFFPSNLKYYL